MRSCLKPISQANQEQAPTSLIQTSQIKVKARSVSFASDSDRSSKQLSNEISFDDDELAMNERTI